MSGILIMDEMFNPVPPMWILNYYQNCSVRLPIYERPEYDTLQTYLYSIFFIGAYIGMIIE
jgi:hypothetical protein